MQVILFISIHIERAQRASSTNTSSCDRFARATTCNIKFCISKNMNGLDDFSNSVVRSRVGAAAMHFYGMEEVSSTLSKHAWSFPLTMI